MIQSFVSRSYWSFVSRVSLHHPLCSGCQLRSQVQRSSISFTSRTIAKRAISGPSLQGDNHDGSADVPRKSSYIPRASKPNKTPLPKWKAKITRKKEKQKLRLLREAEAEREFVPILSRPPRVPSPILPSATYSIIVENCPKAANNDMLAKVFEKYGEIESIEYVRAERDYNALTIPRSFYYKITFSSPRTVAEIMMAQKVKLFFIGLYDLNVRRAPPGKPSPEIPKDVPAGLSGEDGERFQQELDYEDRTRARAMYLEKRRLKQLSRKKDLPTKTSDPFLRQKSGSRSPTNPPRAKKSDEIPEPR